MRKTLPVLLLALVACMPTPETDAPGPDPVAVSMSETRGVLRFGLENGRACRADCA